jgi:hypothetical protein
MASSECRVFARLSDLIRTACGLPYCQAHATNAPIQAGSAGESEYPSKGAGRLRSNFIEPVAMTLAELR